MTVIRVRLPVNEIPGAQPEYGEVAGMRGGNRT